MLVSSYQKYNFPAPGSLYKLRITITLSAWLEKNVSTLENILAFTKNSISKQNEKNALITVKIDGYRENNSIRQTLILTMGG